MIGIVYLIGAAVTLITLAVMAGYLGQDRFYEASGIRTLDECACICSLGVMLWPFLATLVICSIPYFIGKAVRKYKDRPRAPLVMRAYYAPDVVPHRLVSEPAIQCELSNT